MRHHQLNDQLRHAVSTHKGGKSFCPGCSACQRKTAGRSGKGTALRLAVRASEDDLTDEPLEEEDS